ncbi:MAG: tail component [Phage 71_18]|nr:MAG: tail component [Phage 71_18]
MPAQGGTYRSLVIRKGPYDQFLTSPSGTVGQHFQKVAAAVTREAKSVADQKLQRHTGQVSAGFRSEVSHGPRIRAWNISPIFKYLERGTRPHIIRPRRARVLVFTARDGSTVYARIVHHPGTRAYRILETALRRVVGRDR